MLVYPDGYRDFRCRAGACRHSCCIGWEIDIDEHSLARFRAETGALGDKLRRCIAVDESGAHFILGEGERCPFLQKDGLCEMILARGENVLCQICADHPRFRSFYADRTEIGLGLCCEAAAEMLLSRRAPLLLVSEGEPDGEPDPQEETLLALRARLMDAAQDRTQPMANRLETLLAMSGLALPEDLPGVFLSLEQLDPAWTQVLRQMCGADIPAAPDSWEIPLEQLLWYFLYRHIPGALEDDDVAGRIALCVMSVIMVRDAALAGKLPLAEAARMYSAEIEYSDENISALLASL
ncbi:MAG: flagellin lysine-N-methylase [Clostridia bacterium]|nr:flagellin lysine-N-methylase [Clostridia bacterium]